MGTLAEWTRSSISNRLGTRALQRVRHFDILPTNVQLDPRIESLVSEFEGDPTLVATVGLAIDEFELGQLRGTRQANSACVARMIDRARVVELRWSGNPGSIIVNPLCLRSLDLSDDGLEASLDKLITESSLLLTENSATTRFD